MLTRSIVAFRTAQSRADVFLGMPSSSCCEVGSARIACHASHAVRADGSSTHSVTGCRLCNRWSSAAAAQADKQRAEERKRRAEERAAAMAAKREAQGQEEAQGAQDSGDEDAAAGGEADGAAAEADAAAAGPSNKCANAGFALAWLQDAGTPVSAYRV